MKSVRLWFALAIVAAPLLLPAIALAQATASVTGTVDIRPRATLPSNALVTVQLADASRTGAPAHVIVEQTFMTNGAQGPFSFKLQYSPLQIAVNHVYIVQGNIRVGGQWRYTTTRPYPVITQGSPATATVIMDAIPLPNTRPAKVMPTSQRRVMVDSSMMPLFTNHGSIARGSRRSIRSYSKPRRRGRQVTGNQPTV